MTDIVWVWGENKNPNPPARPPTVSVSAWPHLFDQTWQRWDVATEIPDAVRQAKVAFVNLFHTEDSLHIEQIKRTCPGIYVIAMPDAPIDHVLNTPEYAQPMLRQMSFADCIGGRTDADCNVYGTLLNKPTVYLPSPIGPTDWFAQFRGLPKEDYVLSLDHQFAPPNTIGNVATLAALQRHTGCAVKYVGAREYTEDYAHLAGLKAEWLPHLPFAEFVALTAHARLCVDMYAAHSYGRQAVLCAMIGTPCITSSWNTKAPGWRGDVYNPSRSAARAQVKLSWREGSYQGPTFGCDEAERLFGFDASKKRIADLLGGLQ